MGLAWQATSKGLALETGIHNIGPMATSAIQALEALGVVDDPALTRFPASATAADFETAHFVVALKRDEHLPLLRKRFPDWADRVEFWQVDDVPAALNLIEREIMSLTACLISGSPRQEPSTDQAVAKPAGLEPMVLSPSPKRVIEKQGALVRVGRQTKGRRGKGVTTITDIPLDEEGLQNLAARLKQRCGTGGTVKEGRIEIQGDQGDQRDRLTAELEKMGYRVKRVGG
jgi:predicted translation initiation factor SUI1